MNEQALNSQIFAKILQLREQDAGRTEQIRKLMDEIRCDFFTASQALRLPCGEIVTLQNVLYCQFVGASAIRQLKLANSPALVLYCDRFPPGLECLTLKNSLVRLDSEQLQNLRYLDVSNCQGVALRRNELPPALEVLKARGSCLGLVVLRRPVALDIYDNHGIVLVLADALAGLGWLVRPDGVLLLREETAVLVAALRRCLACLASFG